MKTAIIPGLHNQYKLPNLAIVDLSDTRVTIEGLSLFLVCHPKLVKMEHKESFHAFQLKRFQNDFSKIMLGSLSSIDTFLSPDEFEFAIGKMVVLVHSLSARGH